MLIWHPPPSPGGLRGFGIVELIPPLDSRGLPGADRVTSFLILTTSKWTATCRELGRDLHGLLLRLLHLRHGLFELLCHLEHLHEGRTGGTHVRGQCVKRRYCA